MRTSTLYRSGSGGCGSSAARIRWATNSSEVRLVDWGAGYATEIQALVTSCVRAMRSPPNQARPAAGTAAVAGRNVSNGKLPLLAPTKPTVAAAGW